jgi:hypothetical protein
VTKTGFIAVAFGLAAIIMVAIAAQNMRDGGFLIRAYGITAIILVAYIWSLARRLRQVEEAGAAKKEES